MKKILLTILLFTGIIFSQNKKEYYFPKDTSYSLASTNRKILKEYPDVKLVNELLPGNVIVKSDIVYKTLGNRKLHLDIYQPKISKGKNYPAVLLIHGGGWRSGNKSMEKYLAGRLASSGIVAIAVEYRLSIEAIYPAALHDLKSALKWTIKNAEKLGINRNKLFISGESAGGHLAALVGVTSNISKMDDPGSDINTIPKVAGIINIDGVLDMTTPSESRKDSIAGKPQSAAGMWLGAILNEKPDLWREVSPINYIDENTPPILFINSSIPRYHAGRDEVISKLNKLGIYSEVHTIEKSPHSFWYFHPWIDEVVEFVINFIKK